MTRPPLDQAIRDRGFTPSVRDVGALVDLLADDDLVKYAERAIDRVGVAALETLRARFASSRPPLRARVLRAIGRFAQDAGALSLLLAALDDEDAKTRRNAAIFLGHARAQGVEDALLVAWERDSRIEMRRSIAASLGKIGTARSLAVLDEASHGDDAELSRIAARGALMIGRTQSRVQRGRIDAARVPDAPVVVDVSSRRGLEDMLAEELAFAEGIADVTVVGAGKVRARLGGAMGALFAARTMLSFRFPLPTQRHEDGENPAGAVARAAASAEARRIFSTWTVGSVRYRLAWGGGGHRRAATWQTAGVIAQAVPELVNDPTASLWELLVETAPRFIDVALIPRAVDDPRFAWRRRDVPAASHPTIAAALVRVAGVRADDVVWDPFVGSGGELIERGLAGAYASLVGSDVDATALAAARENLNAAGLAACLVQANALEHAPRGVTLVITNPPMGRRASRMSGLSDMLDRFIVHAASVLVPGGRFAWIAPSPARARAVGARAGLTLDWARTVDMGGFDGQMQRWTKK